MKSQRICVFCLAYELENWLKRLCDEFNLGVVSYYGNRMQNHCATETITSPLSAELRRIFLHSKSKPLPSNLNFGAIMPRVTGWVDVTPGGMVEQGTERIVLITDIEVAKNVEGDQPTWKAVLAMRKRLSKDATLGVVGTNTVTSCKTLYRDIWYSARAEEEHANGAVWKQGLGFNVVFSPSRSEHNV